MPNYSSSNPHVASKIIDQKIVVVSIDIRHGEASKAFLLDESTLCGCEQQGLRSVLAYDGDWKNDLQTDQTSSYETITCEVMLYIYGCERTMSE
ncbi:hypothetical protein AcW1_001772 [Taiwanofungus camphoratus]|nr:hypothetical protein AcV5_000180 [Antrodia cinnamomea]KAI0945583.1 hypothetical protein AcW1_001772 [Antrodia cinnamomea]